LIADYIFFTFHLLQAMEAFRIKQKMETWNMDGVWIILNLQSYFWGVIFNQQVIIHKFIMDIAWSQANETL